MLKKVISGGQTGADYAGVNAAKISGLETGGWMPKGFLTQDGLRPEYAARFGMIETEQSSYPPRTALNVKNSDGTLRLASDWSSRGEQLTLRMIQQYKKPYLDIKVGAWVNKTIDEIFQWLVDQKIEVLNVAGNSERTSPGIQLIAETFLTELFQKFKSELGSSRVEGS